MSALTFDAAVSFDSPLYGFDGSTAVALKPDAVLDVDLPSSLAVVIDGEFGVDQAATVTVDEPIITDTGRKSGLTLDA